MKKEPEYNFVKLIICFLLRQLSSLCLEDNKKKKDSRSTSDKHNSGPAAKNTIMARYPTYCVVRLGLKTLLKPGSSKIFSFL